METIKEISCIEMLDGEEIYVLNEGIYDDPSILKELEGDTHLDLLVEYVKNMISFVRKHDGFMVGLRMIRIKSSKNLVLKLKHKSSIMYMPCIIYFYNGRWERVQIEHVKCDCCEWNGDIANPTVPDLYFGLPDRFSILHRVWKLSVLDCPKCGNRLSEHAIWIEK